jgi:hypothetical protein
MSPMTTAERTYCASEFFFKGIFSTLVEVAKDQKAGDPAFIIGNFARAFGPETIALLPEFHVIECSGIKAWEIGFWNQDNNPESVWIVEKDGVLVTTTCKHIVGLLELKHIQELPWSKFNWEEAAEALSSLSQLDNLWDWSGKQAVIDMMAFTRLYYQVEKHLSNS